MGIKTDSVKADEAAKTISRLKDEMKALKTKMSGMADTITSQKRKIGLLTGQLKEKSNKLTECTQEGKATRTKMAAGEGALMGEIARNKKTILAEKDRWLKMGNQIAKNQITIKKSERLMNRQVLKKRSCQQALFTVKRSVEKWKTKFETLQMAHTTTTQRLRDTRGKMELTVDRLKDAKIKTNGCKEAMTRMKTYTNDQSAADGN